MLHTLTGRRVLQPFWETLHRWSLAGMNFGQVDVPTRSGEAWVLSLLQKRLAASRGVVFDVGANVGAYAKMVLSELGTGVDLFCFEPSPAAFVRLQARLADNPGVHIFNFGFGDEETSLPLYADTEGSPLASAYRRQLDHLGIEVGEVEQAEIKRLDDFCRDEDIDEIDLLKLDTEGHELRILLGSKDLLFRRAIGLIQFEFGGTGIDARLYFRDYFHLLNDGYRLFRVLQDGICPIDEYSERREIFEAINYLAVRREPRS